MAPAATEPALAPTTEQKPVKETKESLAVKPPTKQGSASLGHVGSDVPQDEEIPEVLTNHREPLKLSGALDQSKAFDVTPIIGREFVDVDLAEILRAPNSDDLIRDLAITSESERYVKEVSSLTYDSLAAGCCVLPQARWRYQ